MTSMALDLATVAYALRELATSQNIGASGWRANPSSVSQERFLQWFNQNREQIAQLTDLEAVSSPDYRVLNSFLTDRSFKPQFDNRLDGVGVVSVLDMLVSWYSECRVTQIRHLNSDNGRVETYPAFEVPADGTSIYDVVGCPHPLVRLRTLSGHGLWLMEYAEPENSLDLAFRAQSLLGRYRSKNHQLAGATIPMLDMSLEPDIAWLKGMAAVDSDWFIADSAQEFTFRMDERGAHAKAATSLTATRGIDLNPPKPYVFDGAFMGWFTQPGNDELAVSAFYADLNSWKKPEGDL